MDNNIKKLKCYDLLIDPDDQTKVSAIALVEDPAIKIDFVAFSNQENKKEKFKFADQSKRMLAGVFMRANEPIYRHDEKTGEEYFVRFSAEQIENGVKKFFKNKFTSNINTDHDGNNVPDVYVVDSWYIRDANSNPIKCFGFTDVKPGDWVGTVHVENQEYWDEFIKTGKLRGFSVEGLFAWGPQTQAITTLEQEFKEMFGLQLDEEQIKQIDYLSNLLLDDDNS